LGPLRWFAVLCFAVLCSTPFGISEVGIVRQVTLMTKSTVWSAPLLNAFRHLLNAFRHH
jgi:hypothetical protein